MQIPNKAIWFMYVIFVLAIIGLLFALWILPEFQKGNIGIGITFVFILLNPLIAAIVQLYLNNL